MDCIVHPPVGSLSFGRSVHTRASEKGKDCDEDGAADHSWTAFSPVCRPSLLNGLSTKFHFNPSKSPIAYSVRIGFLFGFYVFVFESERITSSRSTSSPVIISACDA